MKAQNELGLSIDKNNIADYEKVVNKIDLDSIRNRELKTRHDVKARIEEFNFLAQHEDIHKGLTSRDLTENVEQLQIKKSLELINLKTVAILDKLAKLANEYSDLVISGRSHNVAAQPTTLGKRFASCAEELLIHHKKLENLITEYPLRGIKGPVGTSQDLLDLFENDQSKIDQLENKVAKLLGFENIFTSVGQIYPRSLDFDVVSTLFGLSSAPSSLALSIRLMAGHDLVTEGFKDGQVGSSAMPHKMNTRSCERINGLHAVLKGFLSMTSDLAGNQWNEGDVSCSVVRRVIIQDAFFATDGILNSIHNILTNLVIHEDKMKEDLQNNLPFLCSSTILMYLVKSGLGREESHKKIKDLVNRYSQDSEEFKKQLIIEFKKHVSVEQLEKIFQDFASLSGNSVNECESLYKTILKTIKKEKSNLKFEMRF